MERKKDDDFQQAFIDAKVQNPESFSFITKNEEGYTTDHTAPIPEMLEQVYSRQKRSQRNNCKGPKLSGGGFVAEPFPVI